MNVGAMSAIGAEYYCTVKNRQASLGGIDLEPVSQMEQEQGENLVSPEEKYLELSGIREQKIQELGLEYVDPGKCTWKEFRSLCQQVLEKTEYDACPLEELGISPEDENMEMDCLNDLRRWSEEQMERGNMAGFHMGKRLSGAIANYTMDMRGETNVLEVNGEKFQAGIMEDGMSLKANYLGSAFAVEEWGTVCFDAMYAADSTADNPIVEIHMYGRDGSPQVYRVVLADVDVRNATQLEMFALWAHWDMQGGISPVGDGSYMAGMALGIFNETSVEKFTEEKRDWVKAYRDKMDEIENMLWSASPTDWKEKYTIGNFELPRKEWEAMLQAMDEMWQKLEENVAKRKELEEEELDKKELEKREIN